MTYDNVSKKIFFHFVFKNCTHFLNKSQFFRFFHFLEVLMYISSFTDLYFEVFDFMQVCYVLLHSLHLNSTRPPASGIAGISQWGSFGDGLRVEPPAAKDKGSRGSKCWAIFQ